MMVKPPKDLNVCSVQSCLGAPTRLVNLGCGFRVWRWKVICWVGVHSGALIKLAKNFSFLFS